MTAFRQTSPLTDVGTLAKVLGKAGPCAADALVVRLPRASVSVLGGREPVPSGRAHGAFRTPLSESGYPG